MKETSTHMIMLVQEVRLIFVNANLKLIKFHRFYSGLKSSA